MAHIIPTPDGATLEQRQGIARDIRDARGRVIVPETTRAGFGQGNIAAPQRDMESRRVGPDPSATALALQDSAAMAVLRALGIPPGLYSGSGGASREAYRQFFSVTVLPLAKLMLSEFRVKLNVPTLTFDFDALAAADFSARTRGVGTLVTSRCPAERGDGAGGLGEYELRRGRSGRLCAGANGRITVVLELVPQDMVAGGRYATEIP